MTSQQHYALFDTPIGICGIEWGPRGINGVQLPMGSEKKIRARIRQRRRGLDAEQIALANAGAGFFLAAHRQLHAIDAARAPFDAAGSDRGLKKGKMLVGHVRASKSSRPTFVC